MIGSVTNSGFVPYLDYGEVNTYLPLREISRLNPFIYGNDLQLDGNSIHVVI